MVSNHTPFSIYNNKGKGVGCECYWGGRVCHMVTLYWGPVPLMGWLRMASKKKYIKSLSFHVHVSACECLIQACGAN